MINRMREPMSSLTHLIGALLSALGLVVLVISSILNSRISYLAAFCVFGISMILLYTASSIYHGVNISDQAIKLLRKLDHSMIYVLIAGTYTPICVIALRDTIGWGLLLAIWSLAIIGIVIKLMWMNAPRWLYTMFYVFMGWISVIAIAPLAKVIPVGGIVWLAAGGVMYTVGAFIYALERPKLISRYIGFHEIFHIFVMAGSLCHYWLMLRYLMFVG